MIHRNIRLLAALVCIILLVSCTLRGQEKISDDVLIQIVKEDCLAWCLDDKDLVFELGGYDERGHVMVGIWKMSTNSPEAGYHVDPASGEITRKYILNGVLELIENGVKVSASQITDVTFSKLDNLSYGIGTSRLLSVTTDLKEIAKFRGSLMALFGDPIQESENSEDVFTYVIQAQRSNGDKWILIPYQGSSGFAIGGTEEREMSQEIAYLLMQRLASMVPSDFEKRDIEYTDSNETYFYGCQNGECYAE